MLSSMRSEVIVQCLRQLETETGRNTLAYALLELALEVLRSQPQLSSGSSRSAFARTLSLSRRRIENADSTSSSESPDRIRP
jgi:hypothetical protein